MSQGSIDITSLALTNVTISLQPGQPIIQINGSATIAGTLTIALTEPPTDGLVLPVLNATIIVGNFTRVETQGECVSVRVLHTSTTLDALLYVPKC